MAFPYEATDGFVRVKAFYDNGNSKAPKYLQPKGSGVHIYTLPPVREILKNVRIPLCFTEGEKKAAKAVQEGLMCIGLGGLWSFTDRNTGEILSEINEIALADRDVIFVPDSDMWARPDLQKAVYAFCYELQERGAKISIVVIPQNAAKVGLDDFLINHTVEDFRNLNTVSLKHPSMKQHKWKRVRQNKEQNSTQFNCSEDNTLEVQSLFRTSCSKSGCRRLIGIERLSIWFSVLVGSRILLPHSRATIVLLSELRASTSRHGANSV
jgi:hypothetical protein